MDVRSCVRSCQIRSAPPVDGPGSGDRRLVALQPINSGNCVCRLVPRTAVLPTRRSRTTSSEQAPSFPTPRASHSSAESCTPTPTRGQSSRHRSSRRARRWVYIEDEDSQATPAACADVVGAIGLQEIQTRAGVPSSSQRGRRLVASPLSVGSVGCQSRGDASTFPSLPSSSRAHPSLASPHSQCPWSAQSLSALVLHYTICHHLVLPPRPRHLDIEAVDAGDDPRVDASSVPALVADE